MSSDKRPLILPPGLKPLEEAPDFKPDVDPRLLNQIQDPADQYQVESMSIMRQDIGWLKRTLVIAYNLSIENYDVKPRVEKLEEASARYETRFNTYRFAPLKIFYWFIGITVHTTVTSLITIYVIKHFASP